MGLSMPKIAIIGAGGNVGSAVAQWCVQKELGQLVLLDVKGSVAQGRGLDLSQCAPFKGFHMPFVAGEDPSLIAGADVVVMTAGVPRKPGQTREELIGTNAGIVKAICENIKKHAPNAILIVVSNPLDAMVYVAKQMTGFPKERVIGSAGILDSSRFRANIAAVAQVAVSDVQAIVLGAHTDKDMVPLTSSAMVGNVPLSQFLTGQQIQDVLERTKKGGGELTGLIGTSAWLAPGAGTALMVESIVRDQKRILPCSVELTGEFGVQGAFVGVPVQLGKGGAERIFEVPLSASEKEAFQKSVEANKELMGIAKTSL